MAASEAQLFDEKQAVLYLKNPANESARLARQRGQSQALDECGIVSRFKLPEEVCRPSGDINCAEREEISAIKLLAGRYWAQNMIGADLLKGKIKALERERARSDTLEDRLKKN